MGVQQIHCDTDGAHFLLYPAMIAVRLEISVLVLHCVRRKMLAVALHS